MTKVTFTSAAIVERHVRVAPVCIARATPAQRIAGTLRVKF